MDELCKLPLRHLCDLRVALACRGGDHRGLSNRRRQLDRRPRFVDAEAPARQDFLVDARVEIGEAFAELDLLPINRDRSERRLDARLRARTAGRRIPSTGTSCTSRALELDEAAPCAVPGAGARSVVCDAPNSQISRSKK